MSNESKVKASDLLVSALENEGVDYIFGLPGEENIDFLDSLRTSSIRFVLTRHEQGAAFMAATYGRLTGKVGVCLATLGPGATNLVTGAAYAQLGGFPLLMITGQKPIRTQRQGRFQIIDVVAMMTPVTKHTEQIVDGFSIPSTVRNAFRVAHQERPGAVHLELPEDVAQQRVTGARMVPALDPHRPECAESAIAEATTLLCDARRPLILVGAGANRQNVIAELSALVRKTGIPFFNTQMGKGVVEGCPDQYIGTAALSEDDRLHDAIALADVILNVGHDLVEKPPFLMRSDGPKVIHLNYNSAEIDEVYFPQLQLIGDIAASLCALAKRLEPSPLHDFADFYEVRDEIRAKAALQADDARFPMAPGRVVDEVRRAMPQDGIIALDNGMYKIFFAANYRTDIANTVLLDNALASMGAGLPSAMAAAMVHSDRRVMAICGDGGFLMNGQELETAVRLQLNLVVLVLNDASYGMIRVKQAEMGHPDWGLSFGNPDFVVYAQAHGAKGHRIETAGDLAPLIKECFSAGGVHLIDAPISYDLSK